MKIDHSGIAANTHDCFSTFIGCKVIGVLFNALPFGDKNLSQGTKTLVFEGGWGITISSNGNFWTDSPDEIQRAIRRKKEELAKTQDELRGVLQLAGA